MKLPTPRGLERTSQAGEEPGKEEESPAFAATVEEPLEGAHTPFGLGRAARGPPQSAGC